MMHDVLVGVCNDVWWVTMVRMTMTVAGAVMDGTVMHATMHAVHSMYPLQFNAVCGGIVVPFEYAAMVVDVIMHPVHAMHAMNSMNAMYAMHAVHAVMHGTMHSMHSVHAMYSVQSIFMVVRFVVRNVDGAIVVDAVSAMHTVTMTVMDDTVAMHSMQSADSMHSMDAMDSMYPVMPDAMMSTIIVAVAVVVMTVGTVSKGN